MTNFMDTTTPTLTALLLARCAALRAALETAAREALAGNGHAGSMQALSDDDRMQERIAPLLPTTDADMGGGMAGATVAAASSTATTRPAYAEGRTDR